MKDKIAVLLGCIACSFLFVTINSGCAQISSPTGGPRDSIAPKLVKANPELNTVNFKGNKITLTFNEYIDLQELQGNFIISPLQKTSPVVSYNLKSVTIKFKDSLLPNTTYSIAFGNAIKDVHEGNVLKNFTYVFSTGNIIDSLTLSGKVVLAESGGSDSTVMIMLYRNLNDTAVLKDKPDYITRSNGSGEFKFNNLPDHDFRIYALKDGDGGRTYNSKTEIFAFTDSIIRPEINSQPVTLYAYSEQKIDNTKPSSVLKVPPEKRLKYSTNLIGRLQDLLEPFVMEFNNPLKRFDSTLPFLTDTNFKPIPNVTTLLDSTGKKVITHTNWQPETAYYFVLPKTAAEDSVGNVLAKTDTIRFITKPTTAYGSLLLRFSNLDITKHPMLQFVQGDVVKYSFPLSGQEWSNKQFPPGEYFIRILYDLNNNGKWDPGNYEKKVQPEIAVTLDQKLAVKANWDNERDVKL